MSRPKWTPGPLWVDPEEPEDIMSECGELVATTYPMDGKPGEAEANAVLYAAAPGLYAAANLACLMFERMNASALDSDWLGDDQHEAWTALSLATAKARGEAARVEPDPQSQLSESDMERDRR